VHRAQRFEISAGVRAYSHQLIVSSRLEAA